MIKSEMKKYNMILTTKISTSSSGKVDNYDYLTREESLSYNSIGQ